MANNTDLIDRYLRNELTENEKKQFEGLLSASDKSLEGKNLSDEMELQKEIIMAIQARGLKECLQKKETEMRAKRAQRQRIIKISSWSFTSSLVAAVLVLAFITAPMAKIMRETSQYYASTLAMNYAPGTHRSSESRGEIDYIHEAKSSISQDKWEDAEQNLDKLYETTFKGNLLSLSNDEFYLFCDYQWLRAMCEMHKGHVLRAKHLLKWLANPKNENPHTKDAKNILEMLKNAEKKRNAHQ